MRNLKERMILLLVIILMTAMLGFVAAATASAETTSARSYVNAAGEDMGQKNCIHVNPNNPNWTGTGATNGWYAVTTTWVTDTQFVVDGTVNLILCDSPNQNGSYSLIADKGIVLKPGLT